MPRGVDNEMPTQKWSHIHARVRGNLAAVVWKDKKGVHILTNVRRPLTEGSFCDECGKALKSVTVATISTCAMLTKGQTEWLIGNEIIQRT
jgi:hypothetical protein